MVKRILILLFPILIMACHSKVDKQYPTGVEAVLKKAGCNRAELEKAIHYFAKKKDKQMLQAIYFLIENMDIHYSNTYYWRDKKGNKVDFSEFDYPNFQLAVDAIDSIREARGRLEFQDTIIYDMYAVSGQFLIDNVNRAFRSWRQSHYKGIPFQDFCEYILPYRVTVEPLQDWRSTYEEKYSWISDSLRTGNLEQVLIYAGIDFKLWFTSTYGKETRNEPLTRLGAQQLLFRQKGACEDIATLQAFSLRSQGIPVSYDIIPRWATSMGSHFVNEVFDEKMNPIKLDVTDITVANQPFKREPAKVFRVTYSKQAESLAMQEDSPDIPFGYLRMPNYKDVTSRYWTTTDITVSLFEGEQDKITYAYVYNYGDWQPVWWGRSHDNAVTFTDMPVGAVFLPAYYRNGWMVPTGYPVLNLKEGIISLKPDFSSSRTVELSQQEAYLIFRPGKRYELFYWDGDWKSLGIQIPKTDSSKMQFRNVPENALLLLIPEYSEGKERPFTVDRSGVRHWW